MSWRYTRASVNNAPLSLSVFLNILNTFKWSIVSLFGEKYANWFVTITILISARWTSVTFVKSARANKDRRDAIRDTWAGMKLYRDARFVTVFIVGRSNSEDDIARKVRAEHEHYGDILLLDLFDASEWVRPALASFKANCIKVVDGTYQQKSL